MVFFSRRPSKSRRADPDQEDLPPADPKQIRADLETFQNTRQQVAQLKQQIAKLEATSKEASDRLQRRFGMAFFDIRLEDLEDSQPLSKNAGNIEIVDESYNPPELIPLDENYLLKAYGYSDSLQVLAILLDQYGGTNLKVQLYYPVTPEEVQDFVNAPDRFTYYSNHLAIHAKTKGLPPIDSRIFAFVFKRHVRKLIEAG